MPFGTDFDRKMSGNPWTRRPKISALEHGVADRRDAWVGLSSRPERLQASLGWKRQNHQRERNGALLRVLADVCAIQFRTFLNLECRTGIGQPFPEDRVLCE